MARRVKLLKTDEEVRIAWDQYRLRIIAVFRLSKEPLTVKQVADIMGEVPAKVHYHVQKLLSIDYLELVKTEVIRGIIAKYYTCPYDLVDYANTGISDKVYLEYGRNAHYSNFLRAIAFFSDSMQLTNQVMKKKSDLLFADSVCTHEVMYLTPEERDDFEQYIIQMMNKYSEPGEGKKEYGFIGGLTRRT